MPGAPNFNMEVMYTATEKKQKEEPKEVQPVMTRVDLLMERVRRFIRTHRVR